MTVEQWLGEDNQIGIDIWYKKYRDGGETFDQWLDRVSGRDPDVREMIKRKEFLFGGRILANRGLTGNGCKSTMSNCYVLGVEDSIESIFDCGKQIARTFSYGGGVGIDLGNLAPRGAVIRNAAKTTSGAVSFMDLYSLIAGLISQSGRRGALMISMPVDHPDIEEFITIKQDLDRVNRANISVRISDEFMRAVEAGSQFRLHYTRKATGETIEKFVDARMLFYKIAECNWNTGEPGALFWDRIKNWNYLNKFDNFEFAGTNPCGRSLGRK